MSGVICRWEWIAGEVAKEAAESQQQQQEEESEDEEEDDSAAMCSQRCRTSRPGRRARARHRRRSLLVGHHREQPLLPGYQDMEAVMSDLAVHMGTIELYCK